MIPDQRLLRKAILSIDHFTRENLSIGVKHFTTDLDVPPSITPTGMSHYQRPTDMAIKMPAYLLTPASNTGARWSSRPR
jgi:hypothetical protein